jgi:hypothetical protein
VPRIGAIRTVPPASLFAIRSPAASPAARPDDGGEAALARLAAGRIVIVAARPGTAATEYSPIDEDHLGLLTARLIEAAEAPGAPSLAEAFDAARREMTRLSAQAGFLQTPALHATGADPKAIRFPRRR